MALPEPFARMRERHWPTERVWNPGETYQACVACSQQWPCDTSLTLDEIARLQNQIDGLEAENRNHVWAIEQPTQRLHDTNAKIDRQATVLGIADAIWNVLSRYRAHLDWFSPNDAHLLRELLSDYRAARRDDQ